MSTRTIHLCIVAAAVAAIALMHSVTQLTLIQIDKF